MKTKLVTCFYAEHTGPPYWGKLNRKEWYAHSLISICNTGCDIICYTDSKGEDYLNEIKNKHNLNNLNIKYFELTDSPYHEDILRIRLKNGEVYNNEFHPFYTLPAAIYWIKWLLLQKEQENNIYLYWIDVGLSTGGLIPFKLNTYKDEPGFKNRYFDEPNFKDHEYKYHSFYSIFNPETINRINNFVEDKILNLCRGFVMDNDYRLLDDYTDEKLAWDIIRSNQFPVAAMFGGKSELLTKYIDAFDSVAKQILVLSNNNYVCTEQEIMGYIHIKYPEWFKNWEFTTFYHEESSCWDSLQTENYPLKSFYTFFLNPNQ